jgi:protein tyrosine/serine phosphatase
METPTIVNFRAVWPGRLYRSGQPTAQQIASELPVLGVNADVDLREPWGRGQEAKACASAGIAHHNIPIGFSPLSFGILPPTDDEMEQIDALVAAPGAVMLVHCQHGDDRTGAAVAWLRMRHDGWTNADALADAVACGLDPREVLIRHWIETVKVAPAPTSVESQARGQEGIA